MPDADLHLAIAYFRAGEFDAAEPILRRLLSAGRGDATALHLLGLVERQAGRRAEARDLLERASRLRPTDAALLCNLAMVCGELGEPEQAARLLEAAARLKPDSPEVRNNLGVALRAAGALAAAESALRAALRLRPDFAEAFNNLGNVLRELGRLEESIAALRRAAALLPCYGNAYHSLAATLEAMSAIVEAIECRRHAIMLSPQSPCIHDGLLLAMHYDPGYTPEAIFAEHLAWAERHAAPLYAATHPHGNDRTPHRRLRVGYVSPDFRDHPVTRFFLPVLRAHDRERVQVFCYSDVSTLDEVTATVQELSNVWRDVRALSDEDFCDRVRRDRIDVLVDLCGHLDGNRLLAFARRPAPVQVTYLGYPDTSGLRTMDYRITDSLHDPPGLTEHLHSERLVRLDPCCWCYEGGPVDGPPLVDPPCQTQGVVTFANLNRLSKVNAHVLRLWSQILSAVPGSRLMVLVAPGGEGDYVKNMLERGGICSDRIVFVDRTTRRQYLDLYRQVDIALDTYPYNGHTTTCDALSRAVPVVSLVGRTHAARAGLSVLNAAGLPELAAENDETYVARATGLAADIQKLRQVRAHLRASFGRSPLMQPSNLARSLEYFFSTAWAAWCQSAAL